jgi:hypothetical protein
MAYLWPLALRVQVEIGNMLYGGFALLYDRPGFFGCAERLQTSRKADLGNGKNVSLQCAPYSLAVSVESGIVPPT